ncbi:hypothetical protein GCM10023196_052300 [Actinoallomurus vinaceus]|uniref:Uncharacterized protein n=1 Tax=Actinoallomurus vinaceus TaxID=1080074 RepID=A0ABP8UE50_9ACTN
MIDQPSKQAVADRLTLVSAKPIGRQPPRAAVLVVGERVHSAWWYKPLLEDLIVGFDKAAWNDRLTGETMLLVDADSDDRVGPRRSRRDSV